MRSTAEKQLEEIGGPVQELLLQATKGQQEAAISDWTRAGMCARSCRKYVMLVMSKK
jgi:hypothetical protein